MAPKLSSESSLSVVGGDAYRMKKLLRINPGFVLAALFVAMLVAGALLGGFGSTRVNGSLI